ncbi:MAG TPA: MBL fold metallo-hydrolase [Ktedonobacterales bacterium]|nr:MBL fold metallo-hydrolase [Ktedonobacterales bacterium]
MARIIFLGTSAALPAAHRANTCLAVLPEAPDAGLLIDCGGDVYGAILRAGIPLDAISDLFITHAHIDHIGSLPSLIESFRLGGRTAPLHIWSLPEVDTIAQALMVAFSFELKLDSWTFPVTFSTVSSGQELTLAGSRARALAMDHAVPSAGLRLELPGGTVAYTSDTQPTPAIQELGKDARILITECTYLSRDASSARMTKHSTAQETGEQAAACGVAKLALVHIGQGWTPDEARTEAARAFSGEIIIPNDGDMLAV